MDVVVFACTHNAGRSRMAEAFFNVLADPARARATSAGTTPADRVHPGVVEAMREVGIDLATGVPRKLTEGDLRGASRLVTMGCGENCPFVPGLPVEDWALPDPKDRPLEEVRTIRDTIRAKVALLLAEQDWSRTSNGVEGSES